MQSHTRTSLNDPNAGYEELVERHRAAFQRLARRLAGNADDAEDLLQESLLDAYRAFDRFRPGSHFYSWVARIMTNNYLDRIRRRQQPSLSLDQPLTDSGDVTLDVPDESANPEHLVLREQLDPALEAALESLQPFQRITVLLCDVDGATYEEAAEVERCPIGTIRSRLHRAHRFVRKFLKNFEPRFEPEPATPVHSRRQFLRNATAAAVAGAGLTHLGQAAEAAEAAPAEPRVLLVSGSPGGTDALRNALHGAEPMQVSAGDPDDAALRETDVLLVREADGAPLREDRLRAVASRVRHDGMGLIVTEPAAESALLTAVLGEACVTGDSARREASPMELRVTAPRHPIARGIAAFRIPEAAPDGGYRGPRPDLVVFDGAFPETGEAAWQGLVWRAGRGKVFVFRPRDASAALFGREEVARILRNAVAWCAAP